MNFCFGVLEILLQVILKGRAEISTFFRDISVPQEFDNKGYFSLDDFCLAVCRHVMLCVLHSCS